MHSDPDLHNAISMHPIPFQYITRPENRSGSLSISRSETGTPSRGIGHSPGVGGISTAVEAHHPPQDEEHIARHIGSASQSDLENQRNHDYINSTDPYHLSSGLKTDNEIASIHANTSRKRVSGCASLANNTAWKTRKLKHFYEEQNKNIERLLKPVDEHRREARAENDVNARQFKIAVNGSFLANVLLAILQVYGAASSGSLSLFTTMADALFDPMSNVTLILSHRAVNHVDPRRFPSGKARIETAGNIVFCFLMCSVSFILIVLSIKELVEGAPPSGTNKFHLPSVIAVAIAFCTKLALFLYCWALRNRYSQIRILWEDHRNDLFINGFGILTSVGGSKLRWFIDPMGAIVLSCLIAFLWLRTAYSEFQLLIGVSADTAMLQHITYISMTHSPSVVSLDTVRAWHSGPRLIVEVDIVMDPEETLRSTHDVAEELQMKLESLPDVERAYVHVDYETSHAPEHFLKKEL